MASGLLFKVIDPVAFKSTTAMLVIAAVTIESNPVKFKSLTDIASAEMLVTENIAELLTESNLKLPTSAVTVVKLPVDLEIPVYVTP